MRKSGAHPKGAAHPVALPADQRPARCRAGRTKVAIRVSAPHGQKVGGVQALTTTQR